MDDLELLCQNAWLLMDRRNAIRANEGWSQIKVNVRSGLCAGSMPWPTVGTYLEYWEGDGCVECSHKSHAVREGVIVGTLGLVCKIAGNPGTGSNCCQVAWGDGKVTPEGLWPFPPIYRGFYQACLNNPLPEQPSEHDLAWLIEQLKNMKKQ